MMGSVITRAVIMMLGYVYPAYECFKSVERNKPDVEQLRFWCQYWMIIAVVTVLERLADTFISWLPMYSEAKLAFIIYLWYPKTKGTTYVYSTFMKPLVAKHELEIDRNLNEMKTRAGDTAFIYWQRASVYVQSRFFELLQYIASQSPPSQPQAGSGVPHFAPPPGYQPRPPPPPSDNQQHEHQPPPGYHSQPPVYRPPLPPSHGLHQGAHYREEETDYDVIDDAIEPMGSVVTNVSEPTMAPAGIYMTRSRHRTSRRQQ